MEAMGTETGMKTLYQALASGLAQVLVLHGQAACIKERWLRPSAELPIAQRITRGSSSFESVGEEEQQAGHPVPFGRRRAVSELEGGRQVSA